MKSLFGEDWGATRRCTWGVQSLHSSRVPREHLPQLTKRCSCFPTRGGDLKIPYDRVNDLEYGQKAGRRLGVAIMVTPLALFSKKRKHYLTVGYQDDNDKQQAAVFELGKDIVRVTLASLEARTGRKIEYQDEEARKSGKGN